MSRVVGSFSRLVSLIFLKNSNDITLRPNQATTYSASRDVQLPPGDTAHTLVSATSTQTLTGKTLDAASNTLQNITNTEISASAAISYSKLATLTATRALVSDGSGYVSSSSVTGTELGYLSGVTSAIQTQLTGKLALAGGTMVGNINLNGQRITNVPTSPTANTDAVNQSYVDAAIASNIAGVTWKAAVATSTTANITLSGEQTIDGVLTSTSRVLVKNQTTTSQNGVYVTGAGAWVRATDFDSITPVDEINGSIVPVTGGSTGTNKAWQQTATVVTVGTDPISFTNFPLGSTYVGGNGVLLTGNSFSVNHDGDGLQFNGIQLSLELNGSTLSKSASGLKVAALGITNSEVATSAAIDATKIGGGAVSNAEFSYLDGVTSAIQTQLDNRSLKAATTWVTGDGTTKTFTHSLNTKDVVVSIRDNADDQLIFVDTVTANTVNQITLVSAEAPGGSGWRVIVHA